MAIALKNPTGPVSPAAFQFATDLITKVHADAGNRAEALLALAEANAGQVSALIDMLKASLNGTKAATETANKIEGKQPVKGWYLVDGKKYQVKISKATGFAYLLTEDGGYLGAKGHAAPILAKIVATGLDLAIAYGKATGSCGICSKTLTDPVSIAAGIGPVCAKKF